MRGPKRSKVRVERRLRRRATDAETILWLELRDRRLGGLKFVRQEAIGPYIADFVCRTEKHVIELDGGQHADNKHDVRRDAWLGAQGYRVLRFWNPDVMKNKTGVLETILAALRPTRPE